MVSLAGSVNMVSCGCLALSSLSFEFRGNLLTQKVGKSVNLAKLDLYCPLKWTNT